MQLKEAQMHVAACLLLVAAAIASLIAGKPLLAFLFVCGAFMALTTRKALNTGILD